MNTTSKSGFTLFELSIVLVIIALLVGSILIGKTIIRQSQVTSSYVDAQRYIKAAMAFKDKYGALPGDFANATSYWGAAGGSSSDNYTTSCYTTASTGTLTCNGDGNGQISAGDNHSTPTTDADEKYRFWQHLANEHLIQGTYTGVVGSPDAVGSNVPATQFNNATYYIDYVGNITGTGVIATGGVPGWYAGNWGHALRLQFLNGTSYALTTEEAQSLDSKYDDGYPSTGSIITFYNASSQSPNCASTTLAYNVSIKGQQCNMIFITGF